MNTKDYIILILSVLLVVALIFSTCSIKRSQNGGNEPQIEIKRDTVYSTDTITVEKEKIRYVDRIVTDTLRIRDTVLLVEQKTYKDSIAEIYVSGINPNVDSVHYFIPFKTVYEEKTITVTQEVVKKRRVTFGFNAGLGVQYDLIHKTFGVGPQIGAGVQVNL